MTSIKSSGALVSQNVLRTLVVLRRRELQSGGNRQLATQGMEISNLVTVSRLRHEVRKRPVVAEEQDALTEVGQSLGLFRSDDRLAAPCGSLHGNPWHLGKCVEDLDLLLREPEQNGGVFVYATRERGDELELWHERGQQRARASPDSGAPVFEKNWHALVIESFGDRSRSHRSPAALGRSGAEVTGAPSTSGKTTAQPK